MEYYFTESMLSKTLGNALGRLDGDICKLEEEVRLQKMQAQEWQKLYNELLNQQLKSGQEMIAGTLLAAMGSTVPVSQLTPASAIMLRTIREMNSIEEVHAYLDKVFMEIPDGKVITGTIIKHRDAPETYGGVAIATIEGNFAIAKKDQMEAAERIGQEVKCRQDFSCYKMVEILEYI